MVLHLGCPVRTGTDVGDIGLKTRGWGNVSVENNHIDVFIFDFADVLRWLSKEYNEPRFADFAAVISSSMRQLLPYEGHQCGIAKKGYYPEVVTAHQLGLRQERQRVLQPYLRTGMGSCFLVGVALAGTTGRIHRKVKMRLLYLPVLDFR